MIIWDNLSLIILLKFLFNKIRIPKVPLRFFDKLKYEIRLKFWFLSLEHWNWDTKHKTNWFFDFQSNRTLKFTLWFFNFQSNGTLKFTLEVRFSFFILIWKTKNQIYLKKYLIKLVTRSHYAITIKKYKRSNGFNDQTTIFFK